MPDDGALGDAFGNAVAVSGNTAVIAADSSDENGNFSGSAYFFDITTGQQITKLLPDDGAAEDQFGWSVAINGSTAVVGAPFDDDNGIDSDSAYVFTTDFCSPFAPRPLAANGPLGEVVSGDFDGDGTADLAVSSIPGRVSLLLNANGGLVDPTVLEYDVTAEAGGLVAGDVDNDGDTDLVTTSFNPGAFRVHKSTLAQGTPGLTPNVSGGSVGQFIYQRPALADFNGDGFLDLALASGGTRTVIIRLNDGTGAFPATSTTIPISGPPSLSLRALLAGDFDNDGDLDLALARATDELPNFAVIMENQGGTLAFSGSFSTGGGIIEDLAVADFDGDGNLDLAFTHDVTDDTGVLLGRNDLTFDAPTTYPAGDRPARVAAADFNGDNITDLAFSNFNVNTVTVLTGVGDGSFELSASLWPGIGGLTPNGLVAADFNGDGLDDPAFASTAPPGTLVAFLSACGASDGCNVADIAEPFGVLDLGDIDLFIIGFSSGDAVADVVPPTGVLDLDDIDAFITAFLAGCP